MLCCLELGDRVVDLDEELKQSGESISGRRKGIKYNSHTVQCFQNMFTSVV